MRWTDMSEKDMIKMWAKEEETENFSRQYLPIPNDTEASYWCNHDAEGDIKDYDFKTVPELKQILKEELSEDFYEDLILPIVVAAFKEKKVIQNPEKEMDNSMMSNNNEDGFVIPEFVYVF